LADRQGAKGTAVQIGGSIAQFFSKQFKLNAVDTRIMLTAGIAAGFGAVFGTPLAGAIFALEVLALAGFNMMLLLACLNSRHYRRPDRERLGHSSYCLSY
jgi:H+/Cl- antiporter ClcA